MAFLRTGSSLQVLKEAAQPLCIGEIHPFIHTGILCLTVSPKTHLSHKVTRILYKVPKNPISLVQEYHAFCGSSFNLLCTTCSLWHMQQLFLGGQLSSCTSYTHFPFTYPAQENNFFPLWCLTVINLNFPIITNCSNVICAVHFYLDSYFQTGYLDGSTPEQRLHRAALCELKLYFFIFLLRELRDTWLTEVVIPIKSQIAVSFRERYEPISNTFEIPEIYEMCAVLIILFAYHSVSFGSH